MSNQPLPTADIDLRDLWFKQYPCIDFPIIRAQDETQDPSFAGIRQTVYQTQAYNTCNHKLISQSNGTSWTSYITFLREGDRTISSRIWKTAHRQDRNQRHYDDRYLDRMEAMGTIMIYAALKIKLL
jgi:hypothetical protein